MKRRGLEGGINLVRGLREELRDLDFNLSEVRKMKTACKAKIAMILARVHKMEIKSELKGANVSLSNGIMSNAFFLRLENRRIGGSYRTC